MGKSGVFTHPIIKMTANRDIVIVDIPSPGILGGVFSELILALTHSFNALGLKVHYERRLIRTTNPVIIFGLYREFINQTPAIRLPDNYFIFNLAPILKTDNAWFTQYVECLSKHQLIDYSYHNISHISQLGSESRARHLFDFGYFEFTPFKGFERNDTYLFYGKLNEHRLKRLKAFQEAGLKLKVLHNTWGYERDIQIATAKGIINIAKYAPNILEVYRLWHSLCLGAPVYSDAGIDETLAKKYAKYVNIADTLDVEQFLNPAKSSELYKKETSFIETTRNLLAFIKQ